MTHFHEKLQNFTQIPDFSGIIQNNIHFPVSSFIDFIFYSSDNFLLCIYLDFFFNFHLLSTVKNELCSIGYKTNYKGKLFLSKRYLHVFYLLQVDCRLGPSDLTDREVSYWYYGPATKNQHQISHGKYQGKVLNQLQ